MQWEFNLIIDFSATLGFQTPDLIRADLQRKSSALNLDRQFMISFNIEEYETREEVIMKLGSLTSVD